MKTKIFYEEKTKKIGEENYYETKDKLLAYLKNKRIEKVKEAIDDFAKNKVVADIGCGEGYITLNYAKNVKKVICSDISENALKKAAANLKKARIKNFEIHPADAANLEFKADSFDAVLCCSALDHVPNPIKVIKELSRIAKKGGYVFIELDNDIMHPFSGIRINKNMLDKLGHFNRISYRKLKKMVKIADVPLKEIKVYSWGSPFRFYYRLIKYFPFTKKFLDFLGRKFPAICYEYLVVYRKI